MPFIEILTAHVGAAHQRDIPIEDKELGVIANEPGTEHAADMDAAPIAQVFRHVCRSYKAGRRSGLGCFLSRGPAAKVVEQDPDVRGR